MRLKKTIPDPFITGIIGKNKNKSTKKKKYLLSISFDIVCVEKQVTVTTTKCFSPLLLVETVLNANSW